MIYSLSSSYCSGEKIHSGAFQARIEVTASTAYALRFVAEHADQPFAAIAPHAAADEYGLVVIGQDIQEISGVFTRFWILGTAAPDVQLRKVAQKVSLALTLPDNLLKFSIKQCLFFSWRGINLTKIESRLKTVIGRVFFHNRY